MGITISNSSRFVAKVFSQKHSSTFVGNVGIYGVGIESVYKIGQSGKTECFASVSQEGLTRELLAKHSCLHPVLTLHIPIMCKAHASFRGMFSHELPTKTLQSSICLSLHTLSLSHTQSLQLNPILNTGYKRLNKITIKFGTELKPTKQIVVNYNFTTQKPIATSHHHQAKQPTTTATHKPNNLPSYAKQPIKPNNPQPTKPQPNNQHQSTSSPPPTPYTQPSNQIHHSPRPTSKQIATNRSQQPL